MSSISRDFFTKTPGEMLNLHGSRTAGGEKIYGGHVAEEALALQEKVNDSFLTNLHPVARDESGTDVAMLKNHHIDLYNLTDRVGSLLAAAALKLHRTDINLGVLSLGIAATLAAVLKVAVLTTGVALHTILGAAQLLAIFVKKGIMEPAQYVGNKIQQYAPGVLAAIQNAAIATGNGLRIAGRATVEGLQVAGAVALAGTIMAAKGAKALAVGLAFTIAHTVIFAGATVVDAVRLVRATLAAILGNNNEELARTVNLVAVRLGALDESTIQETQMQKLIRKSAVAGHINKMYTEGFKASLTNLLFNRTAEVVKAERRDSVSDASSVGSFDSEATYGSAAERTSLLRGSPRAAYSPIGEDAENPFAAAARRA